MNISEKMKRDWDERAQHHAKFWIATENYHSDEVFSRSGQQTAQALLTALQGFHQPIWKVLDIGCGIGRVLKPLAPFFQTLVGVDVSSAMIAQSKSWLAGYSHISTLENSGIDLREFSDASFDLVYSYVAFQHMPRPVFDQYLGEINRVLTKNGYLAFQIPIGPYQDVPIEDTIGIRSYPILELEQKLRKNGLEFLNDTASVIQPSQPIDHRFHIIRKVRSIKTTVTLDCLQLNHPPHHSALDLQLYERFAENCVKLGNPDEGIQTLQFLVHRTPEHLSGWLRLAALLLETGQVEQAVTTLQELSSLHPRYQEGQLTLQQLRAKCQTPSWALSREI